MRICAFMIQIIAGLFRRSINTWPMITTPSKVGKLKAAPALSQCAGKLWRAMPSLWANLVTVDYCSVKQHTIDFRVIAGSLRDPGCVLRRDVQTPTVA